MYPGAAEMARRLALHEDILAVATTEDDTRGIPRVIVQSLLIAEEKLMNHHLDPPGPWPLYL